jgi:hypothetical protein
LHSGARQRETRNLAPQALDSGSAPTKSAVADLVILYLPNSGKPEFGWRIPERQRDGLLAVLGQDPFAGPAEPPTVLLETAQNNLIALVDHGPAKPRNVTRAGIVPLLCGSP